MHILISYLIKLSISISIVWLFYQFVLRRLTFYNNNRWFLLFFSALSFFIPFINVSFTNTTGDNGFVQLIPSVHQYTIALEEASNCPAPIWSTQYDKWDWTAFALMTGAAILFIRFVIRYLSFLRIRNKAELISDDGVKIYQVDAEIIPFSFGNSVFINCSQHSAEELEEIVRHEFVHVRQKHTIDIVWAELLCILNWYNPFAWLLKKSIRQNLEFIADNKVVENGIDKKQYQYLLLKVIGNNQYSIATQFNFSSLKKRIAMMNKTKSTKRQVIRFLFLLPVLAIILLSFRKSFADNSTQQTGSPQPVFTDTVPEVKEPNSKGYIINIKDKSGECEVVIKDKDNKEVKRLLLTEWNENAEIYEQKYGEIPPVPAKLALPTLEQWVKSANPDVKSVSVIDGRATVTLRNGKVENYDLSKADQKKSYESKYGKLTEPPAPPVAPKGVKDAPSPPAPVKAEQPAQPSSPPAPPAPPSKVIGVKPKEGVKADFDLKDDVITVTPKNGIKEVYDLKNAKEKKQFEDKYGDPVLAENITTSAVNNVNVKLAPSIATTVAPTIALNNNVNTVSLTTAKIDPVINTNNVVNLKLATTVSSQSVLNIKNNISTTIAPVIQPNINTNVNVNMDIIITILKTTTEDDLDKLITKMKEKGYDLKFTNKNYNDGVLTNISGTIKHKGSSSTFSVTDFNDLSIAVFRDGDEVSFKVLTNIKRVVI